MSKEQPKEIVGLLKKSRDDLSKTGSSCWFSLFPGSKREGDEWVPDGTRPPRLLIVSKGQKTWLDALDIKVLVQLLEENQADLDAGYILAGIQLEESVKRQQELLKS